MAMNKGKTKPTAEADMLRNPPFIAATEIFRLIFEVGVKPQEALVRGTLPRSLSGSQGSDRELLEHETRYQDCRHSQREERHPRQKLTYSKILRSWLLFC